MQFEERVFEVEKRGVVDESGREEYSSRFLDELEDGPAWFEARSGRALQRGLEDVQLPLGWKWSTNWKIVMGAEGADEDGWVADRQVRRRKWLRKRERMETTSSSSSSAVTAATKRPSAAPASSEERNALDEATALRICGDALQLLDEAILRLGAASERRTIEGIMREGKAAIADCQKQLQTTVRGAAKIKVSNDLARDQRRFDLALQEAFAVNAGGKPWTSGAVPLPNRVPVLPSDSEEERDQTWNQQQQLRVLEEKRRIQSNEVDFNAQRIQERHEEITKIHKMTHQVNGMMKDLAAMVAEQGDDIQHIKKTTSQTKDNVQAGLDQVHQAEQHQQDGGGGCVLI